jgi:ketosteroid isomerase-like protein
MWAKETIFDDYDTELEYDFEELEFVGSAAYAWGWFRQALNPKDGSEALELRGKFLDVFKKNEAGEWKLARCAYSTDSE